MRDPERIGRIPALVRLLWVQVPDWRLGQLISNMSAAGPQAIFHYEDDDLEEALLVELNRVGGVS